MQKMVKLTLQGINGQALEDQNATRGGENLCFNIEYLNDYMISAESHKTCSVNVLSNVWSEHS